VNKYVHIQVSLKVFPHVLSYLGKCSIEVESGTRLIRELKLLRSFKGRKRRKIKWNEIT